ncbi:MAG: mediator of RNA polymerase II transcription subunit 8 [Thelocarpon impressellum]|nr:MAG: mediator of RNA polymerase II transcription subunit 8 [Thelocarpon impressellum]
MAHNPPPRDLKALEQTRQRLFQLTNSLASLQQNIQNSSPLPPWTSLLSLGQILAHNLTALSTHLASSPQTFSSTTAYPLPTFPAAAEEALLQQLLRKKLEPGVEDWVREGREAGEAVARGDDGGGLSPKELNELWAWAGPAANEEARGRDWVDEAAFTREEEEAGMGGWETGLRRDLEDDDEGGDDEGADTAKEASGPGEKGPAVAPLSVEEVLRFVSTGVGPGPR